MNPAKKNGGAIRNLGEKGGPDSFATGENEANS